MTAFAVMLGVGVSSAAAQPTGEYSVFAQCPTGAPKVKTCILARTQSGEVKLGRLSVPIVKTQTLQGGLIKLDTFESQFAAALDGETFTKTPQKVPGGLLGFGKCDQIVGNGLLSKLGRRVCEAIFENRATGVNATIELAAPASSIVLYQLGLEIEQGSALYLPVKVKLENPLLGGSCYIGSDAEPVQLALTDGTSGTLKGKLGSLATKAGGGILEVSDDTIVDGAFAAPPATGCGPGGLLDGVVNSKLGLPAATGNTAILNNTIEEASPELIEGSEES